MKKCVLAMMVLLFVVTGMAVGQEVSLPSLFGHWKPTDMEETNGFWLQRGPTPPDAIDGGWIFYDTFGGYDSPSDTYSRWFLYRGGYVVFGSVDADGNCFNTFTTIGGLVKLQDTDHFTIYTMFGWLSFERIYPHE